MEKLVQGLHANDTQLYFSFSHEAGVLNWCLEAGISFRKTNKLKASLDKHEMPVV